MEKMLTADDFKAETNRRRNEDEEKRKKRREELVEKARPLWPDLAEQIQTDAIWHRRESKVEKRRARSLLGLQEVDVSDADYVLNVLAKENGFEMENQYETTPFQWIFQWIKKDTS